MVDRIQRSFELRFIRCSLLPWTLLGWRKRRHFAAEPYLAARMAGCTAWERFASRLVFQVSRQLSNKASSQATWLTQCRPMGEDCLWSCTREPSEMSIFILSEAVLLSDHVAQLGLCYSIGDSPVKNAGANGRLALDLDACCQAH